jgi:hypothetical protein
LYFDSVDTGFYRLDPFAVPRIAFYIACSWSGARRYRKVANDLDMPVVEGSIAV